MNGRAEERPQPMLPWNLEVAPGDPVEIFRTLYYFDRVDADHAVTFRAASGQDGGDFMIEADDGRARKPLMHEVGMLMQTDDLIWREGPLGSAARRYARAQELDAAQARAMDPVSQFRMAIVRRFLARPWSRSDHGLKAFMRDSLGDPSISRLDGAWSACPSTVRGWLRERGEGDSRKERDGVSMRNRLPRIRKLGHPLEIVFHHATRATHVRGSCRMNHENYVAEIARINAGTPLDRAFWIDPDGEAGPSGRLAVYPVPTAPYVAIPYLRFWRLCRDIGSAKAYRSKTTPQAEYQRYGGGGIGDRQSHLGARSWMDSTPVPKAFFVDDDTGIPIGPATMTLLTEHRASAVYGWDLSAGACTSSVVLRTVLCGNMPKDVPEDLLAIDPNLAWLRLRPDVIGFDNATETHARSVEDNLMDAYIGCDFTGAHMPRDKGMKERVMGIFLDLLFKHVPDAGYDVGRMRLYGFDEEKGHVLCSLRTGRRLLARAVMTYNVSRSRGRGREGRQPALVWKQQLGNRKLNVIRDVDEFRRGIGTVRFLTMYNSGIEMFGRRYTPGAVAQKRILQEFQRAGRIPKGDIGAKPSANRDDRKRLKFKVKIRYDEDDIGSVRVWNPHGKPARWEVFECVEPHVHGLPKWLDERCREFAEREAMDYLSSEGQALVRSRLFKDIANVDSKAAERDRQTLAKAVDDPRIRQVMSGYVEVVDEVVERYGVRQPEELEPARHDLATGARRDAHVRTPRPRTPPEQEPIKMRGADRITTEPAREPRTGAARHRPRGSNKNDRRRGATVRPQSSDRPDQRTPSRVRSTRLKWGDAF